MSHNQDGNSLVPVTNGRGRGALLAALRKKRLESSTKSEDSSSTTSTVSNAGRGHAQILENLRRLKEVTETTSSVGSGRSISIKKTTPSPSFTPAELVSNVDKLSICSSSASVVSSTKENSPVIKRGETGTYAPATANYIRLELAPDRGVFEYEVQFKPPIDAYSLKLKILNKNITDTSKTFDGSILYLSKQIPQAFIKYVTQHPNDESDVTMTLIFKRQKRLSDCTYLYNVLFKKIMRILEFSQIGRENYDPKAAKFIPQHRLELWPGYVTAVDEYEGGVMLCLDANHRLLRTETVRDFMMGILQKNKSNFRQEVLKTLIGSSVLTRYNNKSYIIDDIVWDMNPKSTFETSTSGQISYLDYYQKSYGIKIMDEVQPLLINKSKRFVPNSPEKVEQLICLVPELCYMTGLTEVMRSDFRVMKDIAMYTRITPNQRMNALRKFCERVKSNPKAQNVLSEWGLKLADATIDLQARVLNPETIFFGNGQKFHGTPQAEWNSAVSSNYVISAIDLHNWAVVHTARDKQNAKQFIECIMKISHPMGIKISKPQIIIAKDDSTPSYASMLNQLINPSLQIIVVICPTIRDDRYSLIKRICCVDKPIASQIILSRTISQPAKLRSIVQKIALQINCKLGGQLWSVKFPFQNWMVCGIDTYHDTKVTGKSVCGFVASLNNSMSRWFSQVGIQAKGLELMNSLKICFTSALRKYYEVNGVWPSNIIIYRDGVGDGEFKACQNYEIPQMEECLKHYIGSEGTRPKLSFVIVQKRINTRIFLKNHQDFMNPSPGSIIDYDITRRDWYDFFLVSQHVKQGTVSPTHYVVIYDQCKLQVDHMQRLTYKMTHLYYNWAGTVRVPAPCQYAHKLAFLVGQNIHKAPSDQLCDRLYYL